MSEPARPDLAGGLVRTHMAITHGLEASVAHSAPPLAERPGGGTREGLALYIRTLALVLEVHERSEDEIVFPFVRGRMPDMPCDMLTAQHREMDLLAGRARLGLDQGAAGWPDVHQALSLLQAMWGPHIKVEEGHLTASAIDRAFPVEEQMRLAEMVAHYNWKYLQPIEQVLPFTLYNLPADQRAALAETMPAQMREQWVPVDWKARWAPMAPFFRER